MKNHEETPSNNRMQQKSDRDLVEIVKSGSLSHAAARYELVRRGKEILLLAL